MKKHILISLFCIFISGLSFSQTVFVTKSGTKYHTENCQHLKSKISIQKSEAIKKGYTPCQTCKPDIKKEQVDSNSLKSQHKADSITTNNKPQPNTTTQQCQAITKAGTQCKRKATSKGYCYQHVKD
jgi:hypothetical protein